MRFVKSFYEIFHDCDYCSQHLEWYLLMVHSFLETSLHLENCFCDPCFRREKNDKYFRCWPEEFLFTSLQYPKWWCFTQGANGYVGFMTWPLLETICPPELLQNINDFPYAWPPLPCIHHTWWYPSAKIQITPSSWTLQHCTYQLMHDTHKCYPQHDSQPLQLPNSINP